MAQAKQGDTVTVHYTGKLTDGTVFDSSKGEDRVPLDFTIGEGKLIPGFEEAVVGMAPEEMKTATIPANEAYGQPSEDKVLKVPRSDLPDGMEPEVNQQLQAQTAEGQTVPVRVAEVAESNVTLDANHPLAGEDLTFELELVEIK